MITVITPVGTSLFTNYLKENGADGTFRRYYMGIEERCASDWNNSAIRTAIGRLEQTSREFISKVEAKAAAELQSTDKIQNVLDDDINVYLLASNTIESRLAAKILSGNVAGGILGNQVSVNFNPDQDVISGLQVRNRKNFLRKGMNALIRRIEQINSTLVGRDQSLAINITGGYGATLPYLTIYAQLKGVRLYYNFQDSNELIEIPPSPLSIDWDAIGPHFDVLERIDRGDALDNWRAFKAGNYQAVEQLGTFIWVDDRDNSAYLSPLGEVFWDDCLERKYAVPFPDPVTVAPDKIENFQSEINSGISGKPHHRPRKWQGFVKRLCENAYVEYVRYDPQVHGGQNLRVLEDGANGHIGIQYTRGDETLPLRVETTAHGKPQTELVMGFIKRQLNL